MVCLDTEGIKHCLTIQDLHGKTFKIFHVFKGYTKWTDSNKCVLRLSQGQDTWTCGHLDSSLGSHIGE